MSYYHIDDNKYSLSARTWSIPFHSLQWQVQTNGLENKLLYQ